MAVIACSSQLAGRVHKDHVVPAPAERGELYILIFQCFSNVRVPGAQGQAVDRAGCRGEDEASFVAANSPARIQKWFRWHVGDLKQLFHP